MSRTLRLLAIAVAAWMLPVTAAHAATYCLHAPVGCVATKATPSPGKIQDAVDDAAGSAEPDEIWIGSGTWQNEPFEVPETALGPLLIRGSGTTGAGATILTSSNTAATRPEIASAGATVQNLQIQIPGAVTGLFVARGIAQNVLVTGSAASTGVMLSEGGRLLGSTVTMTSAGSIATQTTSGDGLVADSALNACTGAVNHSPGGTTTVERTRVAASTGFDADLGNMVIDTSTFRFPDPALPCPPNAAVSMRGTAVSTRVTNLTAAGGDQAGTAGVRLHRGSGSAPMTAEILSSVFTGFAATLVRTAATGDPPIATISASAIDEAQATTAGYIAGAEPNLENPVLGFFNQTTGDFRLTHASELVDRGEAAGPLGSSDTDLAGSAREIEGKPTVNGMTPRRDIGAYEYLPGLPAVVGSVLPATGETSEPLTFEANGDPGDPGEAITYEWAFDDGTTATGALVDKAFATPGDHLATVTATDAAGWTATDDVTVTITDPPPPPDDPAPVDPDPGVTSTTVTPTVIPSAMTRVRPAPAFRGPSVAFTRRAATVDLGGRVALRLRCRATAATCIGRVALTTVRRVGGRNRTIKLGAAAYRIGPGEIATVRIRINRTRLRLLRGTGELTAQATATVTGGRAARLALQVRRRP